MGQNKNIRPYYVHTGKNVEIIISKMWFLVQPTIQFIPSGQNYYIMYLTCILTQRNIFGGIGLENVELKSS